MGTEGSPDSQSGENDRFAADAPTSERGLPKGRRSQSTSPNFDPPGSPDGIKVDSEIVGNQSTGADPETQATDVGEPASPEDQQTQAYKLQRVPDSELRKELGARSLPQRMARDLNSARARGDIPNIRPPSHVPLNINPPGSSATNPLANPAGQPPLPSLTFNQDQTKSVRRKNLAKRGWGLSHRTGIGIERNVTVVITSDRIRVGTLDMAIGLGHGETDQQIVRAVVVDIDEHAKSWGTPPQGFYWVPSVKFRVARDAEHIYQAVERPLREGGLSTKAVYLPRDGATSKKAEVSR